MSLSENLVEIKSEIEALLTYANTTTGDADTRLGEAVRKLAEGYGQGGEGGSISHVHTEYYANTAKRTNGALSNIYDIDYALDPTKIYLFTVKAENDIESEGNPYIELLYFLYFKGTYYGVALNQLSDGTTKNHTSYGLSYRLTVNQTNKISLAYRYHADYIVPLYPGTYEIKIYDVTSLDGGTGGGLPFTPSGADVTNEMLKHVLSGDYEMIRMTIPTLSTTETVLFTSQRMPKGFYLWDEEFTADEFITSTNVAYQLAIYQGGAYIHTDAEGNRFNINLNQNYSIAQSAGIVRKRATEDIVPMVYDGSTNGGTLRFRTNSNEFIASRRYASNPYTPLREGHMYTFIVW